MNIPELSIRLLPIGLGDCILIRFPDSSWAMIDCGAGAAKRDAASMAAEMLEQEQPLDTPVRFVVATHPDTDHVGGIPAFLRFCKRRVEEVFHCGDERCPRSLREALLAPLRGAAANLYLDAGCCVDNQLVIQADGTIRHSVESKSCSERITARSQPIPVA